MAEVKATLTAIMYDDKQRVRGVSYSTTIPTSLPISISTEIISDMIKLHLSHVEKINGTSKIYGRLSGITANLTQECYSFSVDGQPRQLLEKIIYDYD